MDLGQDLLRNPLGDKVLIDQLDLALAADHANVTGTGRCQVIKRFFIVGVAARDDETKGARIDIALGELPERLANVADHEAPGGGETLTGGVALAVVKHPDFEIDFRGKSSDGLADMPTTDDQKRNP